MCKIIQILLLQPHLETQPFCLFCLSFRSFDSSKNEIMIFHLINKAFIHYATRNNSKYTFCSTSINVSLHSIHLSRSAILQLVSHVYLYVNKMISEKTNIIRIIRIFTFSIQISPTKSLVFIHILG